LFIDEAKILVKGGNGGAGAVSYRREKHVPRGGVDGGNGGFGGKVVIEVDEGLKTLQDFKYKRHFKAERGAHGQGRLKNGANGKDMVLKVPSGTLIKDERGNLIIDLTSKGQQFIAAEGGHGGKGNAYFVSGRRRLPSFSQKGDIGEGRWLILELKLLADVGIIGMPNVGKSTFISAGSAARPKIADYPFTTLVPNLGTVETDSFTYVVADIPGLIEGAHKGVGLGDAFLRHVDRAALLLHMVDLSREDPVSDFEAINNELNNYSKDLAKREHIVVGNKLDVVKEAKSKLKSVSDYFKKKKISFYPVSAVTGKGLKILLLELGEEVKKVRSKEEVVEEEKAVTYRLAGQKLSDFEIIKEQANVFKVEGKGIERLVMMTDLENEEALDYLHEKFKAIKLEKQLETAGAKKSSLIKIGSYEFHIG